MTTTQEIIQQKTRKFQNLTANGQWDELVATCYAPDASLSHFANHNTIKGSTAILDFFQSNPSKSYSLNLQYTIVELGDEACLVAGVGSVENGPWCPFVERWARFDKDWFIVEDKVYEPESWMK